MKTTDSQVKFSVKLATTVDEFRAAFGVIKDEYSKKSYLPNENSSTIRLTFYNLLTTSYTIVAKYAGEVVGTITLIVDSEAGLPIDELYHNEANQTRARVGKLAELSGLAVSSTKHTKRLSVAVYLFRHAIYVANELGLNDVCFMVTRKHARYYSKFFAAEIIGQSKPYAGVCNTIAVPLHVNISRAFSLAEENHQKLSTFFQGLDNPPDLRTISKNLGLRETVIQSPEFHSLLSLGESSIGRISLSQHRQLLALGVGPYSYTFSPESSCVAV